MHRVAIIAKNTMLNLLRTKTLFILLFLSLGFFALVSLGIEELIKLAGKSRIGSIDFDAAKWASIFVVFVSSLWAIFLSMLQGVGLIRKDLESRIVNQIFCLPYRREEYFIGRFLGGLSISIGFYFLVMIFGLVAIFFHFDNFSFSYLPLTTVINDMVKIVSFLALSVLVSFFLPAIFSILSILIGSAIFASVTKNFIGLNLSEIFKNLSLDQLPSFFIYMIFPHFIDLIKISFSFDGKVDHSILAYHIAQSLFSAGAICFVCVRILKGKEY